MTPDDIRAFRARHGLSQGDLAALLDIGVRTLAGYETGEYPIRRIVYLALAELGRRLPAKHA